MGLVVIGAMILYLILAIVVVKLAIRYARKHGKSAKRWGLSAVLIMYLIPFWDWIPTIAAHKYYCEKEAGFWVYETLDEWKIENLGVFETLVNNAASASSRGERFDDGHGKRSIYSLNERFNWVVTQQDLPGPLPIIRTEQEVKDIDENEVLARYVNFSRGYSVKNTSVLGPSDPSNFWMKNRYCAGGESNKGLISSFIRNVRGVEK